MKIAIPAVLALALVSAIARAETDFLKGGRDLFERGNMTGAIELWQRVVAGGEGLHQAKAQANLALAYHRLGRRNEADRALEAGFALVSELDPSQQATVTAQLLVARGSLEFDRSQTATAIATWQAAETAYARAGDTTGIARSQLNQAQGWLTQGNLQRARAILTQIPPESPLQGTALYQQGTIAAWTGDRDGAKTAFESSLVLAQTSGDLALESSVLLGLGNLQRETGEANAIATYQQAADRSPDPSQQLDALINAFGAALEFKHLDVARELRPKLNARLAAAASSQLLVLARLHLAQVQLDVLDTPQEMAPPVELGRFLAETRVLARELGDHAVESRALGMLGTLYERDGQPDEALALTRQALVLADVARAPEIAYRWHWQLGRLLAERDRRAALAAYAEAVTLLQELRAELLVVPADARFSFRREVEPVYREYVDLLLQAAAATPSDRDYLRRARAAIEALQVSELVNFLRIDCEIGQLASIERLDPRAATIYPIVLPDRLEIILSLPGRPLKRYRSEVSQEELTKALLRWQRVLRLPIRPERNLALAQQLHTWLLEPLVTDLAQHNIQTLAFVLDGPMRNVPMAALHDGERYTIERYAVAVAPGLQLVEPQPLERPSLRAILAGVTEARQGFGALPAVGGELAEIQSLVPSVVLLDRDFDETLLAKALEKSPAPIVHLATHGKFGSRPEDTFLLTWDERIDINELSALLRGQNRAIELLILSACETARGDDRAALGLAGVAVRAGARSTLASLWQVDDEGTAELMREFYQTLTESSSPKATALRQAQLKLLERDRFAHPFFWSPFVLVGNWL